MEIITKMQKVLVQANAAKKKSAKRRVSMRPFIDIPLKLGIDLGHVKSVYLVLIFV